VRLFHLPLPLGLLCCKLGLQHLIQKLEYKAIICKYQWTTKTTEITWNCSFNVCVAVGHRCMGGAELMPLSRVLYGRGWAAVVWAVARHGRGGAVEQRDGGGGVRQRGVACVCVCVHVCGVVCGVLCVWCVWLHVGQAKGLRREPRSRTLGEERHQAGPHAAPATTFQKNRASPRATWLGSRRRTDTGPHAVVPRPRPN
jgi:hypothetical protein